MAKSKYAPALFEVLNKDKDDEQEGLKVPSWFERRRDAAVAAKNAALTDRTADGTASTARTAVDAHEGPTPQMALRRDPAEPPLAYDGARLRLSLTATAAALVAIGLLLLGWGAYGLGAHRGYERGRASYFAETDDAIAMARQAAPNTDLLAPLRDNSAPAPAASGGGQGGTSPQPARPATDKTTWVRGNTYTIVQEFKPESGNDAWIAREFFAESGISTAVVTKAGGHHWLITTEGYNHKDSAQRQMGKVLAQRVREVGKAYQEAGGRYNCEGYERTLSGDSW